MNWRSADSRSTDDISARCRRARSSEQQSLFGPARRNDLAAKLFRHSFVRSKHEPFLRPGQDLHGRRAWRRSRAAARPAHQRFSFDGREHDGSLAISRDDAVHRSDLGSIDAVERRGKRRAGVVGYTAAERVIHPSLRGVRYRSVQRFQCARTLDTRGAARRSSAKQRARSSKGAVGLMQIMPKTWTELRARYGLGTDPYDPRDNILAGAACIRELYDRYGAPGFLAAYNAGPGRYERHLATGRPLPEET